MGYFKIPTPNGNWDIADGLRSRLDKVAKEKKRERFTEIEKAEALAGRNMRSRSILNKVLMSYPSSANENMTMMDHLGLYGDRIEILYDACGGNLKSFVMVVALLWLKGRNGDAKALQDRIVQTKTEEEFDAIMRELS